MLTVLMTTYNGERYLREQLDSILGQKNCEFNLVISDDCSTDSTADILNEYAETFSGMIDVRIREEHIGSAAKHFFKLIEEIRDDERYVNSRYFALSDQDDIWMPGKLEVCIETLNKAVTGEGEYLPMLVHGDLLLADTSGIETSASMARSNHMRMDHTALNYRLVENAVSGNTVVFNRKFMNTLSFPENCVMHDWWMALVGESVGKIFYIDKALVRYRQHGENVYGSRKHFTAEEIKENYRNMYAQAEALLENHGGNMSTENREILEAFTGMQNQNRIKKIMTIFKYRFFKSSPVMTLGMMLKI